VASRTSAIPSSLPPKTRRKAEAPSTTLLADEPLARPKPSEEPRPKPVEVKVEEPRAPEPPPPEEEAQPAAKSDSLLRLKKRSRAVVALSRTAAFDDILKSFLQEDGYGRVLTTTFPEEVFELLRQPNLGVLLLDGNMTVMESLEFVKRLQGTCEDLPPIVLAAEDISTSIVLAARRNGVAQLVVRPYALDATFSALLSEQVLR